jgi:nitrous oxidase accessory protein
LIVVTADDVTVRGLVLRNTGFSRVEDRAALRVLNARGCVVEGNKVEDAFFGIYLSAVTGCLVRNNEVDGTASDPGLAGNGIHVWQSSGIRLEGNRVRRHRDGIYFEFVTGGTIEGNTSEHSLRYGLHFMFSDSCLYRRNVFSTNAAGVAVMYTRRVRMAENVFRFSRGSAAYGLLLKDISDSEIAGNSFLGNSVGLHLEGGSRNRIEGNVFGENGWALRLLASAQDNLLTGNTFVGNTFDVGTNSRHNFSTLRENYWDRYNGYDMDRDGIGDVRHAPVRLFALIVAQSPPSLILQRSPVVDLLDFAERVIPSLTPETLVDERPLMRRPKPLDSGGSGEEARSNDSAAQSFSSLPSPVSRPIS